MVPASDAFYEILSHHGVKTVFGNPWPNEFPFLTGLPDDLPYYLVLQERAAIAGGFAQAPDTPGFLSLHAAAGTGNAMGCITDTQSGCAPMVIRARQQVRRYVPVGAVLTNLDRVKLADPLVKWSGGPLRPQDGPARAPKGLMLASSAPCGVVCLSVPLDEWTEPAGENAAALAPVRDDSVPRAHLLWAAALLLAVIAGEAPGDPDAAALARERARGLAEPDRVLFQALIRATLGLLERHAGHGPTEAARACRAARLPGEASGPPPPGGPAWPSGLLTEGETRVLRYLPTYMGAPQIAAELYVSANTVKTHLRHLYRKLGAHSRQEAVQRARALGLLTGKTSHRSRGQPRST